MSDDVIPISDAIHAVVDLLDEDVEVEERPAPGSTAQIVEALLSSDGEVDRVSERRQFVEYLARGFGQWHAGLAVGWSEAQIKKAMADPEIAGIIDTVNEYHNDTVEMSILRSAQAGNVQAQKMWALAKMPERGWVEKKTHVIEGQARVDVVHSVREALQETLREEGAIAALHNAYVDAEVVEDETDA